MLIDDKRDAGDSGMLNIEKADDGDSGIFVDGMMDNLASDAKSRKIKRQCRR